MLFVGVQRRSMQRHQLHCRQQGVRGFGVVLRRQL
jgi:hypothetical protein